MWIKTQRGTLISLDTIASISIHDWGDTHHVVGKPKDFDSSNSSSIHVLGAYSSKAEAQKAIDFIGDSMGGTVIDLKGFSKEE